ncbi:diguanylate cyclase [Actinoplanes sp. NEAU-A12]|uniref:Diguanylate cyclase n=1 Tax=Actinoplanes sandaracinus TaxID=3045177 RepID=A0ABT6WSN7_9ACTN|nr:diguanylate cyclase [Actinoplanes sandaracinus]MDI6102744.1 diguanylate cyclase [Actinoplanes sandaracinus]
MTALLALAVIFAVAVVISLTVAVAAWRRRGEAVGFGAITVLASGAGWWSAMALAGLFVRDPALALWFVALAYPGVFTLVAGWWATARALTDRSWRLRRRTAAILAVEPVLCTVALATNPWHHLFLDHLRTTGVDGVLAAAFGPLFWLHAAYSYLLVTLSTVMIIQTYARDTRRYRGYLLAVLASVPSLAINVATRLSGGRLVDLTAIGFAIGAPMMYRVVRAGSGPASAPVTYRDLIRTMTDLVIVVDERNRVIDHNPAAAELVAHLDAGVCDGLPAAGEAELTVAGIDLSVRVSALAESRNGTAARLLMARDITAQNRQRAALEEANSRLRAQLVTIEKLRNDLAEQAVRDHLTGLHNRRHLMTRLGEMLDAGRTPCFALIDIDHFKQVNDRYGHSIGDVVLQRVAGVLAAAARDGDVVARYGGEEFAIVFGDAGITEAAARVEALRRQVRATPVRCGDVTVPVTFSAGLATADDAAGVTGLIDAADMALYAAKTSGRDRVSVSAPAPV